MTDVPNPSGVPSPDAPTASTRPRRRQRRRSKIPKRFSALNTRERRLGELVASGQHSTSDALRLCGFSDTSQSLRDSINRGPIRKYVQWLLDTEGGSPLDAVRVLTGKLQAQETKFFHNPKVEGADGEPLIQQRHVEAHGIQLDAAKTILELHDAFPRPHETPLGGGGPASLTITLVQGGPVPVGSGQAVSIHVGNGA